jgi:N6-L-threonylcarbamoyladenine synthase
MIVLGIESSCDETSVGIVENGEKLLACSTASSMEIHAKFGGVVPEIAAREQLLAMTPTINNAFAQSGLTWKNIDAIAVTYGAGLGGSLLIGVLFARTLAITQNKPLYAINHVEGHIYANFLTKTSLPHYTLPSQKPKFPLLALIVSGGHTQLVLFKDHFNYKLLGQTHDDAIGEAFDKVAKILGLPYPGGPSVAKLAKKGNPHAYSLPIAQMKTVSPVVIKLRNEMKAARNIQLDEVQGGNENRANRIDNTESEARKQTTQQFARSNLAESGFASSTKIAVNASGYDFSFSGLKTAVLRTAQKEAGVRHDFPSYMLSNKLKMAQKADLSASFQQIAIETVVDKTIQAYNEFLPKSVVIAGGVASSSELRQQLSLRLPIAINYTDPKLCTDNGAMIATLGCYKVLLNRSQADPYSLDIDPNLSM